MKKQIATLQPSPTLPFRGITKDYHGTLTYKENIKTRPRCIALWNAGETFILNLDQASFPVSKADYPPGIKIRFKIKLHATPPQLITHKTT